MKHSHGPVQEKSGLGGKTATALDWEKRVLGLSLTPIKFRRSVDEEPKRRPGKEEMLGHGSGREKGLAEYSHPRTEARGRKGEGT